MFDITSKNSHGKALIVGINYTNTPNQLYGCINDGETVKNMARKYYGFRDRDIIFLRDDIPDATRLPTKENILKSLKSIVSESDQLRDIWFHYSGHGASTIDRSGDELDGMDEFLIPCDFERNGIILDDDLFDIISEAKCPVFLTTDCCHSGTVVDLPYSFDVTKYGLARRIENRKTVANQHIYMLSGCQDSQTSDDVQYEGKPEGAFTKALYDSLERNNFEVNLIDLFVSVRSILHLRGHSQKTILSSSNPLPHMKLKCVKQSLL